MRAATDLRCFHKSIAYSVKNQNFAKSLSNKEAASWPPLASVIPTTQYTGCGTCGAIGAAWGRSSIFIRLAAERRPM